jgi:hypothetical protein
MLTPAETAVVSAILVLLTSLSTFGKTLLELVVPLLKKTLFYHFLLLVVATNPQNLRLR